MIKVVVVPQTSSYNPDALEHRSVDVFKLLVEKYGQRQLKDLNHGAWKEFILLMKKNDEQDNRPPCHSEEYLLFGYSAFAKYILSLPESLKWRKEQLGEEFSIQELFWITISRLIPSFLEDLQGKPYVHFTEQNKDERQLLGYSQTDKILLSEEEFDEQLNQCLTPLKQAYEQSLIEWAKKYKLMDSEGIPIRWCLEWASNIVEHKQFLGTGFWQFGIKTNDTPLFAVNDFNFQHQGWHPTYSPYVSRNKAKELITKQFEAYLEEYLQSKDKYAPKVATETERILHVIWLVRSRILGETAASILEAYKKNSGKSYSEKGIYKGIKLAATELGFSKEKTRNRKPKDPNKPKTTSIKSQAPKTKAN